MPPGIPTRPTRPRPISPADNPLTTGLPLNPNGTYVANPYPTTAAAGSLGGYGSGLPTVNVNGQQPNAFLNIPGQQPLQIGNVPASTNLNYTALPTVTLPTTMPTPQFTPNNVPSYAMPQLANAGGGTPMRDPTMRGADTRLTTDGIIHRLTQDPNSFTQLAPTQQEAIERLLTQSAQGGAPTSNAGTNGTATPGTGDFYGYNAKGERVVKNAANGDDFSKELRWDPDRNKYVQIGTLLKEGRMDKYGRLRKVKKGKGGGGKKNVSAAAPEVQQTTTGFTGSYGVVNFSTGTG